MNRDIFLISLFLFFCKNPRRRGFWLESQKHAPYRFECIAVAFKNLVVLQEKKVYACKA
jgi:hypothetical protein